MIVFLQLLQHCSNSDPSAPFALATPFISLLQKWFPCWILGEFNENSRKYNTNTKSELKQKAMTSMASGVMEGPSNRKEPTHYIMGIHIYNGGISSKTEIFDDLPIIRCEKIPFHAAGHNYDCHDGYYFALFNLLEKCEFQTRTFPPFLQMK